MMTRALVSINQSTNQSGQVRQAPHTHRATQARAREEMIAVIGNYWGLQCRPLGHKFTPAVTSLEVMGARRRRCERYRLKKSEEELRGPMGASERGEAEGRIGRAHVVH
mmetsp:Transcript_58501/g.116167  ORF Transcript_58501/g.116167 Transcript_58501/m.116167 type:complete len:109 (-) Transcript_58501:553-879(-)